MAVVRSARVIEAPPERLFAWIADYRNASAFVDGLEPLRPVGGSSFEAVLRVGPRRLTATVGLVEVEPGRLVTWEMAGAASRSLTFRLSPVGAGTSVALEITYDRPGGLTGALVGPVVDEAVRSRAHKALEAISRAMIDQTR